MGIYLVTGIAGFIGSQVALQLIHNGHTVVGVDNLSTGYQYNVPREATFIEGNCQDEAVIEKLYQWKFDAMYHIAGQTSGEVSFDDPVYDLQTNTQSTLQLLNVCIQTGCRKFIYASSMSVYGNVAELSMPVKEKEVLPTPVSFYGIGKLASEHYLRIFSSHYGISTAALRLFNVFGPGQNLSNMRQGMVSIFVAQCIKDKHIHVKGAAERYRDFIYIDDVVNAFIKTEDKMSEAELLLANICSGKKNTVVELVNVIRRHVDYEVSTHFEGSTPGDQFGIFGSNASAKALIGWAPQVGFEEGMRRMMDWAKNKL